MLFDLYDPFYYYVPRVLRRYRESDERNTEGGEKKRETTLDPNNRMNKFVARVNALENAFSGCDLVAIHDGETKALTAYVIRLVYAPFKKSQIDIQIGDGGVHITVGTGVPAEGELFSTPSTKHQLPGTTRDTIYGDVCNNPVDVFVPFSELTAIGGDGENEIFREGIKASTDDGVLEVYLPLARKSCTRVQLT